MNWYRVTLKYNKEYRMIVKKQKHKSFLRKVFKESLGMYIF